MASLTETAYYARRTINWGILAVIAYIILRILWSLGFSLFLVLFPPKAPPPNHAFGKLPALKFPTPTASPSGQLTFTLETIEGSVPRASESAAVYFMPKSAANLLAITRTQDFAQRLGFSPTPISEANSKNIYRFEDPEAPLRRLRYDIVSNNFILRYGFERDAGLFAERNIPSVPEGIAEARGLLQTYNLYLPDIAGGTIKTTFLKLQDAQFLPVVSTNQADALRVDFFRKSIGDTTIVTPYSDEGSVSVIFSGSLSDKKRVLQLAYTFWPIDYQTTATYALKPTSVAWQELQGGGYIARYPRTGTKVVVRNVSLAYYDSFDPQTYLQPIFVFEGDDGFLGYVQAVVKEWTE